MHVGPSVQQTLIFDNCTHASKTLVIGNATHGMLFSAVRPSKRRVTAGFLQFVSNKFTAGNQHILRIRLCISTEVEAGDI